MVMKAKLLACAGTSNGQPLHGAGFVTFRPYHDMLPCPVCHVFAFHCPFVRLTTAFCHGGTAGFPAAGPDQFWWSGSPSGLFPRGLGGEAALVERAGVCGPCGALPVSARAGQQPGRHGHRHDACRLSRCAGGLGGLHAAVCHCAGSCCAGADALGQCGAGRRAARPASGGHCGDSAGGVEHGPGLLPRPGAGRVDGARCGGRAGVGRPVGGERDCHAGSGRCRRRMALAIRQHRK